MSLVQTIYCIFAAKISLIHFQSQSNQTHCSISRLFKRSCFLQVTKFAKHVHSNSASTQHFAVRVLKIFYSMRAAQASATVPSVQRCIAPAELFQPTERDTNLRLLQLPLLSGANKLNNFNFANEIVLVRTCGVVPSVSCVLVQQHAVHGGSGVGLQWCPAVVGDLLQVVLGRPHPPLVARNVVAGCPPTFGFIKSCK